MMQRIKDHLLSAAVALCLTMVILLGVQMWQSRAYYRLPEEALFATKILTVEDTVVGGNPTVTFSRQVTQDLRGTYYSYLHKVGDPEPVCEGSGNAEYLVAEIPDKIFRLSAYVRPETCLTRPGAYYISVRRVLANDAGQVRTFGPDVSPPFTVGIEN